MAVALVLDEAGDLQSSGLADEIARLAAAIDATTHRLLTCIRQFDQAEEWQGQGAQSCAQWLAWRIGMDLVTAREKVRVARALGALPAIDAALARGRLSYAKTRALTRVATPENERRLLEIADATTGEQLERVCRRFRSARRELGEVAAAEDQRGVRLRPLGDGLMRLELTLHADEAALVLQAIENARDRLRASGPALVPAQGASGASAEARRTSRDASAEARPASRNDDSAEARPASRNDDSAETRPASRNGDSAEARPVAQQRTTRAPLPGRADAAVHIAETFLATRARDGVEGAGAGPLVGGGERYQVFVHLDQSLLAAEGGSAGLDAFLDDGTRVAPETLRRVACDGAVVGVATAGDGALLDVGRRTRVIPPAIRRALWVRDRGCRFPGCTNRRFVHGHHIRHWIHGGATSLANLVTLCTFHHQLLHEGGFAIARGSSGELRFLDRWRNPVAEVPPGAAAARPIDDTDDLDLSACGWDGEPIDYDAIVDALVVAEWPVLTAPA